MSTKTKSKQELPSWFNGELYGEGGTVKNRFSGEEYELNNVELSMYDMIMGASIVTEMGGGGPGIIKDLRRGLDWFRTHNPEAYMVLLD